MTDNDIILGLKCIADEDEILCKDCAFRDMDYGFACKKNVSKAAIDLINRQKAKIVRLKDMVGQNEGVLPQYENLIKAEAIKEFAARLKSIPYRFREKRIIDFDKPTITKMVLFVDDNDIDNLVKEMTQQ